MSAAALERETRRAQQQWDRAVTRVAGRWARELAGVDDPVVVAGTLRRMLSAETVNAAQHGVDQVDAIVTAAGLRPTPTPAVETSAPLSLVRTLSDEWRLSGASETRERWRAATLNRVINVALTDAWRDGTRAAIASDPRALGWRRVSRDGCCGACLALADGRIHPIREALAGHPFCRCIMEIVLRGINDGAWGRPTGLQRWAAMSEAEQDALFHGSGGAAKADLIRSGHVTLADLAAWQPRDPNERNHRQLPREATLRELALDEDGRGALTHRTGVEFGVEQPGT